MVDPLVPNLSHLPAPDRARLLISVKCADEARVAMECGADIVDAKDPTRGALGPVQRRELEAIAAVLSGRCPLSAAIGDLGEETVCAADEAAALGTSFAKVGYRRHPASVPRAESVIEVLRRHAAYGRHCALVLATYADVPSANLEMVIDVAARVGAAGVLLDTLDKRGRRLFDLMSPDDLATWVRTAHSAGLTVALAGSLRLEDIGIACETGADIVGVRGAACDGGRDGHLSPARVRALVGVLQESVVGDR